MKKSYLKNIIKEVLLEEKGYSKYAPGGTTSGLTKANLDKILLRIAKGEDLPGDSEERGNKILDKADPDNVARIIRGEDPVYNEEVDRMQELAGIHSEIKVNNPNRLPLYKDAAIEEFEKLKAEDSDLEGGEGNDDFYDNLISKITNSESEDDINTIIFHDFFFDDDTQGMEDFKNDIEAKLA